MKKGEGKSAKKLGGGDPPTPVQIARKREKKKKDFILLKNKTN